ncbi:MAG: hypothetical protein QG573_1923 [Acidobacteriota bacterium]|nr:hypothetical protein [Acidobacteriota bacterium]
MRSPRPGARQAEALRKRLGLSYDQIVGLRFAINVFIATTIVWFTLQRLGDTNPIWAIASMVAASDPEPGEARRMFRSRLTNVFVGCVVGFAFLLLNRESQWMLPLALAVTVVLSTWVIRVKTMWRQAPITAAVVSAGGLTDQSTTLGFEKGLHKVAEVVFGCLVGTLVSWFMSRFWLLEPGAAGDDEGD